jgi:predicted DNA-binding ribbon-helix-helix protein
VQGQQTRRTVVIRGNKTSVNLEDAFWTALDDVAAAQGLTRRGLIREIACRQSDQINLSSAIRVHVITHYRARAGSADGRSPSIPSADWLAEH